MGLGLGVDGVVVDWREVSIIAVEGEGDEGVRFDISVVGGVESILEAECIRGCVLVWT